MLSPEEFYSLEKAQEALSAYAAQIAKENLPQADYEDLLKKQEKKLYNSFKESSEMYSGSDEEKAMQFLNHYLKILNPSLLERPYDSFDASDKSAKSDSSISAKEFHQFSIPYLLKKNDKKYHFPEEKILATLENDKLYHVYQKCLSKLKTSHSPKVLKKFLKAYFKTF